MESVGREGPQIMARKCGAEGHGGGRGVARIAGVGVLKNPINYKRAARGGGFQGEKSTKSLDKGRGSSEREKGPAWRSLGDTECDIQEAVFIHKAKQLPD